MLFRSGWVAAWGRSTRLIPNAAVIPVGPVAASVYAPALFTITFEKVTRPLAYPAARVNAGNNPVEAGASAELRWKSR